MTEPSDAALVGEALARPAAYRHLVARYWGAVNARLRRWVGCAHTADDLTQEAFIKAYQRLSDLREPEKFGGWLRPIAARCAKDWFRRQKGAQVSLDWLRDEAGHSLTDARQEEPDRAVEREESLVAMLRGLKPQHREILELRFREGISYTEIAERLQIPEGTAAARLHRALAELKERLPQEVSL